MRAPRPTTGPTLAFEKSLRHLPNMVGPCFCLFHNRSPANPLVTGEGSKAVPFFEYIRVRLNRLFYVRRHSVHNASSNLDLRHSLLVKGVEPGRLHKHAVYNLAGEVNRWRAIFVGIHACTMNRRRNILQCIKAQNSENDNADDFYFGHIRNYTTIGLREYENLPIFFGFPS